MESLAYLHLALAYEMSVEVTPSFVRSNLKLFEQLNQRKLIGTASISLLSLTLPFIVLGMTSEALAALQEGSTGPQVIRVQKRLQKLGYFNADVTGNFGSLTKDAVIRFQQDKGLTSDGIIGGETEALLFGRGRRSRRGSSKLDSARSSQQPDRSNENIRYLQEQLRDKGFYAGPIDGINSQETQRAVKDFQADVGLKVDGMAGPNTRLALDSYQGSGNIREQEFRVSQPQRRPRSYVVVVPGNYDTLSRVRLFVDNASLADAKQGSYVNAGRFYNRSKAESRSELLRARGFDARVVYLQS